MATVSSRSVLLMAMLAVVTGCDRVQTKKSPASVKPSIQEQDIMNDPEMMKLNEAIRRNPKSAQAYWRRASAWHARDRFDLAFPDYDEAIRLDPSNCIYYDARGFAYHMNNRQEKKALADYNEAIRLDPGNHHALNNRAYLLATTLDDGVRNGKQALKDALKACEMTSWKKSGYLDTLAVAYAEVGEFEQAITWQKKSLEDPEFEKEWGENARKQLQLFREGKPYRE
jgi:tetratricopeptide (TPR) repeat protein